MHDFAEVSRLATASPGAEGGAAADEARDLAMPWMVRRYVRGHIRRKLVAIKHAYTELLQFVDDPDYRAWLTETTERIEKWLDLLPRSRLPLLAAIPLLSPVVGVLGEDDNWAYVIGAAPLVLVIGWVIGRGLVLDSFWFKRELMLPGVSVLESEGLDPPPSVRNVYAREDELFRVLGRDKPGEVRVDLVLGLGLIALVMEAVVVVASLNVSGSLWWFVLYGAAVAVALLLMRRRARRVRRTFG
jgi:hypothetical protein